MAMFLLRPNGVVLHCLHLRLKIELLLYHNVSIHNALRAAQEAFISRPSAELQIYARISILEKKLLKMSQQILIKVEKLT